MADQQPTTTEQKPEKKQKHRSPNYPIIGLEAAIQKARGLQSVAGIHSVRITTARDTWGYQKATGNQVLAALDGYGLVNVEGVAEERKITLSTWARKILDETSDSRDILKKAALSPQLHQDIWEHFQGILPPSNNVIREYLVYQKGFNPAYVDKFIEQFRDSLAFAHVSSSDILPEMEKSQQTTRSDRPKTQIDPAILLPTGNLTQPIEAPPTIGTGLTGLTGEVMTFMLSRTGRARVQFNGQITQEAIDKLIKHLDLSKDTFPTEAELTSEQSQDDYDPMSMEEPGRVG